MSAVKITCICLETGLFSNLFGKSLLPMKMEKKKTKKKNKKKKKKKKKTSTFVENIVQVLSKLGKFTFKFGFYFSANRECFRLIGFFFVFLFYLFFAHWEKNQVPETGPTFA